MGTRNLIKIYLKDSFTGKVNLILTIYRQYDGGFNGTGVEIAYFLKRACIRRDYYLCDPADDPYVADRYEVLAFKFIAYLAQNKTFSCVSKLKQENETDSQIEYVYEVFFGCDYEEAAMKIKNKKIKKNNEIKEKECPNEEDQKNKDIKEKDSQAEEDQKNKNIKDKDYQKQEDQNMIDLHKIEGHEQKSHQKEENHDQETNREKENRNQEEDAQEQEEAQTKDKAQEQEEDEKKEEDMNENVQVPEKKSLKRKRPTDEKMFMIVRDSEENVFRNGEENFFSGQEFLNLADEEYDHEDFLKYQKESDMRKVFGFLLKQQQ